MQASQLKEFYEQMLRIRLVEEKIAELYPKQEMRCPVHLCTGQEAVAVGVSANLSRQDSVFSTHRSHGHYLAKGGDLKALFAELYGKDTGCSKGKGGSMHLVDLKTGFLGSTPIVGGTIPIAVGTAFAFWLRGEKRVSVAFFGEAAIEEGIFYEAANFAVLKKLPVVFVCENNLYSVYSPLSVRQPEGRPVYQVAEGIGLRSLQGEGNDVAEVFQLSKEAVQAAKAGKGPTFLEFMTYRWREHCGPYYDNDLGYRAQSEFEGWKNRCPIERAKNRLLKEGTLDPSMLDQMTNKIEIDIQEAVRFAETSPFPDPETLHDHVYA